MNHDDYDDFDIEPLYTVKEICAQIGITSKTWRTWCKKAGVKHQGIGWLCLYTVPDVYRVTRQVVGDNEASSLIERFG